MVRNARAESGRAARRGGRAGTRTRGFLRTNRRRLMVARRVREASRRDASLTAASGARVEARKTCAHAWHHASAQATSDTAAATSGTNG